jgi:serine/threonine protein kinase
VRKNISGRSEQENDEVQAEFDHEVRVWRYLNHPHVLTLDAVYETDYATFCFTKLAIGGTLFDLVRQNRQGLDPKLAKKYSYQLACAIRYLHEDAHVVHRDIKLENCLLDPVEDENGAVSSTLVLCDFGMAEWMTADNGGECPDPYDDVADRPPPKQMGPAGSSTSVAGSLEYASPELLLSANGVIHPSVDIWAFGVIVFTVIVGSRPFQDPFTPRIQSNILSGTWNHDSVLGEIDDALIHQDRADALELIKGCLHMEADKRWTIRDVLGCSWLREVAEGSETPSDSVWKL